jgi:hypothetical protein
MEIRTIQNRRVEQILEAGLEVADNVTVQQPFNYPQFGAGLVSY